MELSLGELLVVFIVIVILFGPDKIPQIARELGQGIRKMKNAMEDVKTEIMKDTPVSDIKDEIDDLKQSINDINPIKTIGEKQLKISKGSENQSENRKNPEDDSALSGSVKR